LHDKQRTIFYLVSKPRFYHKPTYKSLEDCLKNLRSLCEKFKINELAMPIIGCGLDQLEWNFVRRIIDDVFYNSGVKLTIYYLNEN
jgi:hypothetical protein